MNPLKVDDKERRGNRMTINYDKEIANLDRMERFWKIAGFMYEKCPHLPLILALLAILKS